MRKLFYMNLEKYPQRYTWQLADWSKRVFEKRGVNFVEVNGQTIDNSNKINVGQVLDAHGRTYYSLTQIANLVQMMRNGDVTVDDAIFFEDMYTSGIDSIAYILYQIPESQRPKIYTRCLAQSIDQDDFLWHTGMNDWMAHYEKMVNCFVTGVLATNEEMVSHMKIAGWKAPIYNISGLAFGKQEVLERVNNFVKPFNERKDRVVFASRFDNEKSPEFFMEIINKWYTKYPNSGVEFSILCGSELKSNNPLHIESARKMQAEGTLAIYENLSKNQYYDIVNDSKVMLNTALQDWWSNTVNEGDTLGCNVLYPAYRSFPETFANDPERLYIPWSSDDAINKLEKLLQSPHKNMGKISDWADGTIDRCIDIMEGSGEQWNRSDRDYRKYVTKAKF